MSSVPSVKELHDARSLLRQQKGELHTYNDRLFRLGLWVWLPAIGFLLIAVVAWLTGWGGLGLGLSVFAVLYFAISRFSQIDKRRVLDNSTRQFDSSELGFHNEIKASEKMSKQVVCQEAASGPSGGLAFEWTSESVSEAKGVALSSAGQEVVVYYYGLTALYYAGIASPDIKAAKNGWNDPIGDYRDGTKYSLNKALKPESSLLAVLQSMERQNRRVGEVLGESTPSSEEEITVQLPVED